MDFNRVKVICMVVELKGATMRKLNLSLALIFFGVEAYLHINGGKDHMPKWGHWFTPLGFFFFCLASW
jgi:hypothetical protein